MDVATLSFAIDSKPLADANRELAKLPATARGAEKAVDNLNKSTKELEKTTVAATASTRNLGQYARSASTGWGATAAAATTAANANRQMAGATTAAATAAASAGRVINTTTVATAGAAAAARVAANDNQRLASSALAVSVAYRLAAGVIAALFARGLNSTMRVFATETESINSAFKTLGETWSATFDIGYQAATPLRRAIEDLTIAIEHPAFTGFVQLIGRILFAALMLAVKGVTALVEGFSWLIDNIRGLSVAFAPGLAALNLMDAAFEQVFGVGLYEIIKKSVNFLIGSFVAAYGDIKFLWENFPDIISAAFVGAVNAAIRSINTMVTKAAEGINTLIGYANKIPGVSIDPIGTNGPLKEMDNPASTRLAGAAANRGAQQQAELTRDYLGEAGNYLTNGLGRRRITDTLPDKDRPGGGAAAAADPYAKLVQGAQNYISAKKAETEAIGMSAEAAARLTHEQELLNKAAQAGIALSPMQTAQLKALAQSMAEADAAFKGAKFMDDAVKKANEFIAAQQIERDTLYMSTEAAMAYRLEKELLNQATAAGITLTTEQIAKIQELASAQAAAAESTRKAKEWADFEKETFKGLFADINQGLREGQNVWDAFGNAGLNALNKISDKLMSMAADQLFEAAFPGGGSLGGGLGGLLGGLFGGGGGISAVGGGFDAGAAAGLAGGFMPGFANGAAFRAGNVIPFASGGIVGSPTMFPMSRGRTGLMGEAGPEAIMPLRRGPGGRLGVEAASSNQRPIVVEVYANEDFVTAKSKEAAVQVVNQAAPSIEARAVKKAGEQAPAVMARHERQRGGEWRNG